MSQTRQKDQGEKQIIKNPAVIVVNFLMAGIVLLFVGLAYGYIFTMGSNWLEFQLPKIFWLSTLSILMVSVLLRNSLKLYDRDNPSRLKQTLFSALIFACIFVYCQFLGWSALKEDGMVLQTSPSVSYLYVLTGLHILHVLVGIIFLIVAVCRLFMNTSNEVRSLLFFSDPVRRTRLKLLNTYWHTIDFLWLFLFLAFLFHHT